MKRLAPKATLFVAFYLLTSAATARAECAWVLWNEVRYDDGHSRWTTVQADATKEECDLATSRKVRAASSDARATVNGNIVRPRPTDPFMYRFFCLPDTIDPRGQEGKR